MPTSRPTRRSGRVQEQIRKAGIRLFRERGYHGTSVRTLAHEVGIEAASLYHHFPSKQHLLVHIFESIMEDLMEGLESALDGEGSYTQRLRAATRRHVLFHIERQDETFISHSELRSLTPPNRQRNDAIRDRYESRLRGFLTAGAEAGEFRIRDVPLTTIAILTLCSGVADWFASQGRLGADTVADAYADLVVLMVRQP